MKVRIVLTMAFAANILLGNICMMSMTIAADMPMPHDETMETAMTPMAPMSRADCDHCPHHEEKKAPIAQSPSCAGHCLSQTTSANPSNLVIGSAQMIAALPAVLTVQWSTTEDAAMEPVINPSPPLTSTDSVVLRL